MATAGFTHRDRTIIREPVCFICIPVFISAGWIRMCTATRNRKGKRIYFFIARLTGRFRPAGACSGRGGQIQINGDKANKRCRQKQRICIYGHWSRAAHRRFLKWGKKDISDDEAQLTRFDEITA